MSFDAEINEWKRETASKIVDGIKEIASQMYSALVDYSPFPGKAPYSLGTFVKSHRIGIGVEDTSFVAPSPDGTLPDMNAVTTAMQEIQKLDRLSPDMEDIYISNSCLHAEEVEYIGWKTTPPYWPFLKTEGVMERIAQTILNGV